MKEAINKTNNKTEATTEFYYQGAWIDDPQTNADNCNEYLATIGKETNENVGKPKCQAKDYLRRHSEESKHLVKQLLRMLLKLARNSRIKPVQMPQDSNKT